MHRDLFFLNRIEVVIAIKMGLEEKLGEIGARNRVGLASIRCSKNVNSTIKIWEETGVGYIVLKTMMDSKDKYAPCKMETQRADQGMTIYHKGNTSQEQFNFEDDPDNISDVINALFDKKVAAIPSIGTKKTGKATWKRMKQHLDKTPARVIEVNLRYTYRALVRKYERIFTSSDGLCDEYFVDDMSIKYSANRRFKKTLKAIRKIFPSHEYALIGKLWAADPELGIHLNYLSQTGFDAVTLVNSKKALPPDLSEMLEEKNFREGKLPQMSGYMLRHERDYALYQAKRMNYKLPIFASGGVAVEALREPNNQDSAKKNIGKAVEDIKRCFDLGASYVQLGSVSYYRGNERSNDTVRRIMDRVRAYNQDAQFLKAA